MVLNSNLPEPDPDNPLSGRNLTVHLRSNFTVRMPREALGNALPDVLQPAAIHVQGNDENRRFHFQIFAAADPGHNAFRLLYKMMPDAENLKAMLESQQSDYITMRVLTCGEHLGDPAVAVGTPGYSSVRLATPRDDAVYEDEIGGVKIPKIFADWQMTNADDNFWNTMDSTAFNFVKEMANGFQVEIRSRYSDEWHTDPPNFEGYRDSLSSTFHEAGTLWMGEDPANSVTDVDGRFHRVKNLYCIDQAVFPTCGSANPVLTGLAITRKVVEGILSELGLRGTELHTFGLSVPDMRTLGFHSVDMSGLGLHEGFADSVNVGDELFVRAEMPVRDELPDELKMIPPWNL